jgi:hypothetical protein
VVGKSKFYQNSEFYHFPLNNVGLLAASALSLLKALEDRKTTTFREQRQHHNTKLHKSDIY